MRSFGLISGPQENSMREIGHWRGERPSPAALKSGDIYKPFSPREVVARVRAVLRRSGTPIDAPLHVKHVPTASTFD